ncbi:MAG: iron ABC transporter substrate-binding protein, partial [Paramuribaculum sp.]|nr:iron ABC transporter substrate-binding protein [Paramuribaculum sp.]
MAAAVTSLVSCGGGSGAVSHDKGDAMRFEFARNITVDEADSFSVVRIRNPWDTLRTLHTYVLVADSLPLPSSLPEGTLVRTPLNNALVYSAVHVALIDELGAGEAIGGVCDSKYIHTPAVSSRIADGSVTDCGIGTAPDLERIMMLMPDAIMLSPFENSGGYGRVTSLGIPVIECADYMESSQLGR